MSETASAADATGARRPLRVLFVCTHNSARSVMAEVLLRARGEGAFEVHSAGTEPSVVNALTVRALAEAGLPIDGLRSDPVERYLGQPFDHVITVCDSARQACPVFPGGGLRHHWSFPDPSAAKGTDEERLAVFRSTLAAIEARVERFVAEVLPSPAASPQQGVGGRATLGG